MERAPVKRVRRLLEPILTVVGGSRRRHDAVLLGLVALLATGIRISPIITESVWLDEMFTRLVVTVPPRAGLELIREDKVHPPLYYFLEKGVVSLLGDGQMALRLLSLVCSVLLVIAAGLFVRELTHGNRWAMLSTAVLVAASDMQIYYAMNARSYTLYALLVVLAVWAFHRMVTQPERRIPRIAYGAMALIGVVTHYLVVLYLIALGPAVLAAPRRRQALRNWILWSLPAAAAMAVWLWWLGRYQRVSNLSGLNWVPKPSTQSVVGMAAVLIGRPDPEMGSWPALLTVGILTLLIVRARRSQNALGPMVTRQGMALVTSVLLIPPALLLLASILARQSFWVPRQLVPSQAFVAIALGVGLALLARSHFAFAAAGLAGLVILNDPGRLIDSSPRNFPYNRVAEDVRKLRTPGEYLAATQAAALWPLNYYLTGADTAQYLPLRAPRNEGWVSARFRPMTDSSLREVRVIWLVTERLRTDQRDSLARAGWRVEDMMRYPPAKRPDSFRVAQMTLTRLTR